MKCMNLMLSLCLLGGLILGGSSFACPGVVAAEQGDASSDEEAANSASRVLSLEKRFLHLPVKTGAGETWLRLDVDGKPVCEFIIELATDPNDVSFYALLEIASWQGQSGTLVAETYPAGSKGLDAVTQSNEFPDVDTAYQERYRPQFHFSPRRGWLNDPNGLVYYNGEYHLFYQHNPCGVRWNNMTWGHAVSTDLLHWQELPDALIPDRLGTIFSGSAVVDWKNTSGTQAGTEPPLVALYTYEGPRMRYGEPTSQGMAFSNDRGRTWTKYEKNPIIPHIIGGNRDPKVFWYEPTGKWIMTLYMDGEDYALFESGDLKDWKKTCDIKNLGCSECPDMFELSVDGNEQEKKWVFWGGNGKYLLGSFDGHTFVKESEPLAMKWGGNDYAAQTYSDTPGRRIQFSWMKDGSYPDMPFNQQFTVPRELTLKRTPDGVRLCVWPVKELESLRGEPVSVASVALNGEAGCELPNTELLDMELELQPGDATQIKLALHGREIILLPKENAFVVDDVRAPLAVDGETITLRIVLDRMSMEVFANGGLSQIAKCFVPGAGANFSHMKITSDGTNACIKQMTAWPLRSVWNVKQ
ncbi:MAG: glycoside hydrolase family 32 protein [Planctomycetia bacterium]|nr:glycoside hydrolase family 32 protein [Planctomycetia bacterium]